MPRPCSYLERGSARGGYKGARPSLVTFIGDCWCHKRTTSSFGGASDPWVLLGRIG